MAIDGTNAAIGVSDDGVVYAQSRTRILTPDFDNFGFARWVSENDLLLAKLGRGLHFGEWWGRGIQRGYGLEGKRFSLFNTHRWAYDPEGVAILDSLKPFLSIDVVPVLYRGPMTGPAGFVNEQESRLIPLSEIIQGAARGEYDEAQALELAKDSGRMRFMPHLQAEMLRRIGSQAAPGFMKPEGIVVFHEASGTAFKMTLTGDEKHKGEQA